MKTETNACFTDFRDFFWTMLTCAESFHSWDLFSKTVEEEKMTSFNE